MIPRKDIGKKIESFHEKYSRFPGEDVPTVSRGLSDDVWKNINHAAEDLSSWDVDDVCNFLDELGLFQYQDVICKTLKDFHLIFLSSRSSERIVSTETRFLFFERVI